ncbi:hypothetical protein F9L16_11430 [Agarivorans sp. B2Z047]|uniref:hypothetical protein n=1 Tax=Agarivorans sp. B2Z047 TaxID=2652721 RepID=UPI00128C77F3|nr:hypothetical protein [Agarivorans sp. B2Z047]MPW29603.1 hypothetical protein [Agarivorans sp. B2Z047]UQN45187.1 hypothetical protein LQZ07_12205 [Agarivorans sp. B2Z047]
MSMKLDNETWLIELGDDVIEKKAEIGIEALTDYEKSVYCLWVIDYSIRNSGTLDALDDIYPEAISEFDSLTGKNNWLSKSSIKDISSSEEAYYNNFEELCNEFRSVQACT